MRRVEHLVFISSIPGISQTLCFQPLCLIWPGCSGKDRGNDLSIDIQPPENSSAQLTSVAFPLARFSGKMVGGMR
jgi:hypothetical protein